MAIVKNSVLKLQTLMFQTLGLKTEKAFFKVPLLNTFDRKKNPKNICVKEQVLKLIVQCLSSDQTVYVNKNKERKRNEQEMDACKKNH